MDDMTNPGGEADLEVEVAPETQEAEQEATTELDDYGNPIEGPEPESKDSDEPTDDLEDVEIDGKTYKVPKEAALRQADYTRKTQEVAELRKQLEGTLERVTQASQAETQALAAVAQVETRIADYANIDWDEWERVDPQAAASAWRQFSMLKEHRGQVIAQYQRAQQETQSIAQQEAAKRVEQGLRELEKTIPGWNKDKAVAILDFGHSAYNFSREELAGIDDPRAVAVLHDAMLYRQQNKQQKTVQTVQAQQAVKPAPKVTGGAAAIKPMSDKASIDEWVKAREAQVAKRNR